MAEILCAYTELKPIHKLIPHPENPHKHSPEQIDRLAQLIDYQGIRHPVIVSKRSGFIVAGHGRLAALKKLNVSEVPIDYQDFSDEAQEFEFIVSDNAIGKDEWAALDVDLIKKKIDILPIKIPMLGLKDFEVKKIEPQSEEDEVPETPVEPISKLGDLYELGTHRLMCGDSTSIYAVEKLMNGEKADMVFTDPPYNHAEKEKLVAQSVRKAMKNLSESKWDNNFSFLDVAGSIESAKDENCTVYICTSWHLAGEIWKWMEEATYSGFCVWAKPNPMPSLMKRHWTWATELICYATYGKHVFNFPDQGHAINVWTFHKNLKNDLHPTMKPVELCAHAIEHSSNKNQSVLDLFGGSGSTLIACEKTNRKCFMMELDPHYCDVIVSRWCKYTGQTKIKRNGEEVTWNG